MFDDFFDNTENNMPILRSGKNTRKIEKPYLIFYDFETTGLNPFHEKIIEIAAVEYQINIKNVEEMISFETLVDPKVKLKHKIKEITHIYDSDLKDKPTIEKALEEFLLFIYNNKPENADIYLVAHNNDGFDSLFLEKYLMKFRNNKIVSTFTDNGKPKWKYIDTLRFAQKLISDRWSYSMKSLCNTYNIHQKNAHRAKDDTVNLVKVYINLCKLYSVNSIYEYKTLLKNPEKILHFIKNEYDFVPNF